MGIIEQLDPPSFSNYIKKYRNTICGRHPIGVLLNVSTLAMEVAQKMIFDSRKSKIAVLLLKIMIDLQDFRS